MMMASTPSTPLLSRSQASSSSNSSYDASESGHLLSEPYWEKSIAARRLEEEEGLRVGKRKRRCRNALIVGLWVAGIAAVCWGAWTILDGKKSKRKAEDRGAKDLFDGAKPLIASEVDHVALEAVKMLDQEGRLYWTFRIPKLLSENLLPEQLSKMCASAHDAAGEVRAMMSGHGAHGGGGHFHHPYYWVDDAFADPTDDDEDIDQDVCESTLTYMLDERDTRMGNSLMGMWTAYALARKEGRAFFLDDSRWAYGSYEDYFEPIPKPSCKPPPKHLVLPCPRTALHLIISSSTHSINFGHSFEDTFEDASKMNTARKSRIFGLMREGYEALFHPNAHLSSLASTRAKEIRFAANGSPIALLHVRQGDLRPFTFQYRFSYLPISTYASGARHLLNTMVAEGKPIVSYILSDSTLSTASPMLQTSHPPAAFHPEDYPWLKAENSPTGNEVFLPGFYSDTIRDTPAEDRAKIAKSYILDLAVARKLLDTRIEDGEARGGGEAVVTCGLKSATCRVLGVIVGWEDTLAERRWKNVDGDWGWRGLEW